MIPLLIVELGKNCTGNIFITLKKDSTNKADKKWESTNKGDKKMESTNRGDKKMESTNRGDKKRGP